MASLPPGTVLHGRYVVAREINRGGSAVVYEAADTATGAHVALKVMTAAEGRTALPARAVRREIEYGAALRHCSHVVPLLDAFADGDHLVMVVRQGGGGGGQGELARTGSLSPLQPPLPDAAPAPSPTPPPPPPTPTRDSGSWCGAATCWTPSTRTRGALTSPPLLTTLPSWWRG